MTMKTYCGNLLWQSGLTLLAPVSVREARPENAYERQNEGFRQVVFEFKTQDEPAKCSAWFCESITIEK